MSTPELSHLVKIDDVPPRGLDVHIEADKHQLAALVTRLKIEALEGFNVQATVSHFDKHGLRVIGKVSGRVQQICGIKLEPFWSEIAQPFEAEFQPEHVIASFVVPEDDFETEVPEALVEGAADIGDLAVQVFAMEISPFPKSPDAVFSEYIEDDEEQPSPFAALKDLPLKGDA